MKENKIKKAIKKKIKNIKKQAAKIPSSEDEEAIHQMRLGYKKLRAFIRVINLQPDKTKKIKIPRKLKDVYGLAGKVRDWQLYRESIAAVVPENESYLQSITEKIRKEKINLVHSLKKLDYNKIRKQLEQNLPHQLDREMLRKFISDKIDESSKLVSPQMPDNDLHTLRKHFKDINYNLKFYKDDITGYIHFKNKNDVTLFNKLPEALSTHQDYAAKMETLNESMKSTDPSLRKMLKNVGKDWQRKKETLKKSILKKGNTLFNPPFIRSVN